MTQESSSQLVGLQPARTWVLLYTHLIYQLGNQPSSPHVWMEALPAGCDTFLLLYPPPAPPAFLHLAWSRLVGKEGRGLLRASTFPIACIGNTSMSFGMQRNWADE